MKQIPNILTSLRIVLTGVFVWQFFDALSTATDPSNSVGVAAFWIPLIIYAVAFLTDILDGFLARTFGWVTPVGKILDPLADKLMGVAALICILIGKFCLESRTIAILYAVVFGLIVLKELLMFTGGAIMLKHHKVAYADWYGKIATGVFTAGVILSLLSFVLPVIEPWNLIVLGISVVISYAAMVHYAKTQLFAPKSDRPASEDEQKLFDRVDRVVGNRGNKTLSK
ncbi:MAG: CDP-alcohol phosphatidyltransferase family protein [Clostridia bacterium]|nr:CDP-alcohol phosphatidyltransferase family protein [Clostridia bacterium]